MPPQYPRITISDACADEPALITGILQLAGIRAEEVDFSVKTSDIILSAMNVNTHKMPRKAVAEPVSGFRLNNPVFPVPVVRERPCVELSRNVQSPLGCESDLYSQIRIQESIRQNITLDCHVLSFDTLRHTGNGNCQQGKHPFYNSIVHILWLSLINCVPNFTVSPCLDSLKGSLRFQHSLHNLESVHIVLKIFCSHSPEHPGNPSFSFCTNERPIYDPIMSKRINHIRKIVTTIICKQQFCLLYVKSSKPESFLQRTKHYLIVIIQIIAVN